MKRSGLTAWRARNSALDSGRILRVADWVTIYGRPVFAIVVIAPWLAFNRLTGRIVAFDAVVRRWQTLELLCRTWNIHPAFTTGDPAKLVEHGLPTNNGCIRFRLTAGRNHPRYGNCAKQAQN